MTETGVPPGIGDFEITLFGPGYGESIVLHVGDGIWVLIDSCINTDGTPAALKYLDCIGIDPAQAVDLVVATHWHDDHIRGMAQLVTTCSKATFCCAAALCKTEFLTTVGTLAASYTSTRASSGLREIHDVIEQLARRALEPTHALANRRIFVRDACEIWSLSPADAVFQDFLRSMDDLLPDVNRTKTRAPSLAPNDVAVVLWVRVGDIAVLLGSDLERRGWVRILQSRERPFGEASVFKVPHHGSQNADEPDVWRQMLDSEPFALVTPWQRGAHALPNRRDVQRMCSCTPKAYITARHNPAGRRRPGVVDRTLRESGVQLRRVAMSPGAIRLRRPLDQAASWTVETFGTAYKLRDPMTP